MRTVNQSDNPASPTRKTLTVSLLIFVICSLSSVPAYSQTFLKADWYNRASVNAQESSQVIEIVMVPMRDGVTLYTTVYTPGGESYPVVLSHGHTWWCDEDFWTSRGYAVVEAETRGLQFHHDVEDSYDLINWITQQSWSNGK